MFSEVFNVEEENKIIKFDKYEEKYFHDIGDGIEVEDWDEIVDSLVTDYDIPKGYISQLKNAKDLDEGEIRKYRYNLGEEKKDKFTYAHVIVGKENGLMGYSLVGTQIEFKLKRVVQKKITVNLFFKIEHVRDQDIPMEVKDHEEEYSSFKADFSAGLLYGFKDDGSSDVCVD